MIPGAAVEQVTQSSLTVARVLQLGSYVFCGVFPAITVLVLFTSAVGEDAVAFDFRPFHAAAEAILRGESPYPGPTDPLTAAAGPYVYPPLPALLATPLTPLSVDVAGLLVMAVLVAAALAVPFTLRVRDWRCYGLALLWPPVISAIQTGNMTLILALAAALAWRSRDGVARASAFVGVTLAAKFFLWPLVLWFAATRRVATALWSIGVGAALLLASWAVIGFAGLSSYPDLLRRLEDTVGSDSYTAYIVGLDIGLSPGVARGLWLFIGAGLLVSCVVVARRDEQTGFILALVAALALTPIVWLHYFALLLVVVALAQPRLRLVWFIPLAMVITPGSGHPTPFETSATLVVATLTIVLALRASLATRRDAVGEVLTSQ